VENPEFVKSVLTPKMIRILKVLAKTDNWMTINEIAQAIRYSPIGIDSYLRKAWQARILLRIGNPDPLSRTRFVYKFNRESLKSLPEEIKKKIID
jgi:predicted transcriptional regulator